MKTTTLLADLAHPRELKNLSIEMLESLAEEVRHTIIETVSINGGHLASNLGITELTIALHAVFNSPEDKFIFDVSHQSYPHKLLTGRLPLFSKIRQYKGLSGFCSPNESPHDHFYAGHAGTALSLALGVAKTRDLTEHENKNYVLPILGDASLTCGLTLEALNNIPKGLEKFILVLNDNNMSISNNVGAITNILSRIINSPRSNKIYHDILHLLGKIPNFGKTLAKQGHKVTESLKNLVSTAPFFEQFGLAYVGPVDGHNIEQLIEVLTALKTCDGPAILHVLTVKGKGMEKAIQNPISYHGCRPFNKITGDFLPQAGAKPTFPQIFGRHILKMAERDPHLVTVTPATPAGSCLEPFMKKFPERCLDVGIAEGHAVTFCGGLGYQKKLKVVLCIYATFLQRALDNLFQDVCLQEIPMIFAIDRGGISGPDGSTHHGIYDISFLNAMPNMVICQPRNGHLLKELLESSFSWDRPVAIRYPNLGTDEPDTPLKKRPLGKAEVLHVGSQIAIVALGHMCELALNLKDLLAKENIDATVIDPIFVKPLDSDLFCELFMTHKILVTIEEHSVGCGLGAILNSFIARNHFNEVQILNFGVPETYLEQGSNKELLAEIGLTPAAILSQIRKLSL
jgi:1-deoxy-D-xylulose-5-phosphate synthase